MLCTDIDHFTPLALRSCLWFDGACVGGFKEGDGGGDEVGLGLDYGGPIREGGGSCVGMALVRCGETDRRTRAYHEVCRA